MKSEEIAASAAVLSFLATAAAAVAAWKSSTAARQANEIARQAFEFQRDAVHAERAARAARMRDEVETWVNVFLGMRVELERGASGNNMRPPLMRDLSRVESWSRAWLQGSEIERLGPAFLRLMVATADGFTFAWNAWVKRAQGIDPAKDVSVGDIDAAVRLLHPLVVELLRIEGQEAAAAETADQFIARRTAEVANAEESPQ